MADSGHRTRCEPSAHNSCLWDERHTWYAEFYAFIYSITKLKLHEGLLYNLYGDKELGLNLVPQSVYDMQSAFYPTVEEAYGVPLDTRHDFAKGRSELRSQSTLLITTGSRRADACGRNRITRYITDDFRRHCDLDQRDADQQGFD